jgi:RNA polymerase sigma-70 factor, ECF subfamily
MTVPVAAEVAMIDESPNEAVGESDLICLEAIYRQHHAFVWRNARRFGCNPANTDDVVHEVFLVVARRLHEFRGEAHIRSWLFAITYHVMRQHRRDHARYAKHLDTYGNRRESETMSVNQPSPEAGHQLRQMLAKLSEPKRLVFIMSELEGMTSAEIGNCLRMKTGTVNSRLRAARHDLRTMIERDQAQARRYLP